MGMGMVGLEDIVETGVTLRERGYKRVTPYFIPRILINMAAGHISIRHGLKVSVLKYRVMYHSFILYFV